MLRNLHLWCSTIKINGRMYIIGSDVKCGVCGKEHYNAIELKWHKAKFHGCCPTLQVNFHEAEINCYVKEHPFMTSNKKNQWENVHNHSDVKCEVCGKKHCNAIELRWHKAKFHGFKSCLPAKLPNLTG